MVKEDAYISEIFSSVQGEGPLVGCRQIFVRFSVCDLRCAWCDTPESLTKVNECAFEIHPGSREFEKIKNPISVEALISYIESLNINFHHSISITGGEPLLHHNFLSKFLPELKNKIKKPLYLETGGHRPFELSSVIDFIDYISMDFKLPSSSQAGDLWEKHKEFLKLAISKNKNIWVKIIISSSTSIEDLLTSVNIVKLIDKKNNTEIFLQPVTKINNIFPPSENRLLEMQSILLKEYSHVRILPQVHALMGMR